MASENLKETEGICNDAGDLCGLCDGTHEHVHVCVKCVRCGKDGLRENMIAHSCPPDPKSPEDRLEEARKQVEAYCSCEWSEGEDACGINGVIDRLVQVARLVGRIEQHHIDHGHPFDVMEPCRNCPERDRLLAELEKVS